MIEHPARHAELAHGVGEGDEVGLHCIVHATMMCQPPAHVKIIVAQVLLTKICEACKAELMSR